MYKLEYLRSAAEKDIKRLSSADKKRIKKNIEEKLALNPFFYGKPLRYSLSSCRSMRVGDYRVIFKIKNRRAILIIRIAHRKEAYKASRGNNKV